MYNNNQPQPANQFRPGNQPPMHRPALDQRASMTEIVQYQTQQAQNSLVLSDLSLKVCISHLPPDSTDDFVRSLLQQCGQIKEWKRFMMANGAPKDGGIVEFQNVQGVFTCIKFLHGLEIQECSLLAKSNSKTMGYLSDIKELKRQEYIDFLKSEGADDIPNEEELREKEELTNALENQPLPYEIEMFTGGPDYYAHMIESFKNIINSQAEEPEKTSITEIPVVQKDEALEELDPLLKYKEHERERQRERKLKAYEQDRQTKYSRKLEDLQRWEKNRDREKIREQEKLENLANKKQRLIEEDLNYDSSEEARRARRNPKEYQKQQDERRKMRAKEAAEDAADVELEKQEIHETYLKEQEDIRIQSELRKEEEERQERLKLKRFVEMQEEQEYKQEQSDPKRQKVEVKAEVKQVLPEADRQKQIQKIKQIYQKMPKQIDQIYCYRIDWNSLFEYDIINKICRPWIAKKVIEYMGNEEVMMINIVLKLLNQKCTNQQLLSKISNILDDASQEFVDKLWKVLVFEDMKIKEGMCQK